MGTWEKSFCSIFPFSLTVSNENILVESDFLSNVWIEFDVDGKKCRKTMLKLCACSSLWFPNRKRQLKALLGKTSLIFITTHTSKAY